jgi:hypothetical protein
MISIKGPPYEGKQEDLKLNVMCDYDAVIYNYSVTVTSNFFCIYAFDEYIVVMILM